MHLASGGIILLLFVYKDPDGIKIDSVGTKTRKWRAGSSELAFSTWFYKNNKRPLLHIYPIGWCMYFPQVHTQIYGTQSRLWCFGHAQDLKRKTRDQNRIDFLMVMQLAATFQHLALFSILKFVNAHINYLDRLVQTRNCPRKSGLASLLSEWMCAWLQNLSMLG